MRDISVIGPLNIDLLIIGEGPKDLESLTTWDGPAAMEMTAAGSIGYTVCDLAKLDLDVSVFSCVSDDALGSFIIDSLKAERVAVSEVERIADTKSGIGVYMLIFGGRKRPLVYQMPTHSPWPKEFTNDQIESILSSGIVHCGGYLHFKEMWHGQTVEIFKAAKSLGRITSIDSQFPLFTMQPPWIEAMMDILPYTNILLCDETEAINLTGRTTIEDCAKSILDAGVETVIIKQGKQGSTLFTEDTSFHQDAYFFGDLVDSIGAGDAFDACFLYATLQDWALEKRAQFASIGAGFTVIDVGGTKSFRGKEDIFREMHKESEK